MSAWKKTLKDAPKDRQILVRLPQWDCPCVMQYEAVDDQEGWGFSEAVLNEMVGWLAPDEVAVAEWAELPT